MAAIKAWLENFDKNYLSINLSDYPNIGMNLPIVKLILIVAVAFIIAVIIINYSKANLYLVVKQLMRHGATDEQSAKTLAELRLDDKRGIRRALSSSAQMRSIVNVVGEKRISYEEYLEKKRALAEERRSSREPGFLGMIKRVGEAVKRFFFNRDEVLMSEVDPSLARLFIKEEGKARASKIYNGGDITPLRTALCCVLIALIFVGLMFAMPEILSWINSNLA